MNNSLGSCQHVKAPGQSSVSSARPGLVECKTTWLSDVIRSTASSRGPEKVIAASFTVTAAQELISRGLPMPKGQVGTLHSLCYRSLDRPPVAQERLIEWNKRHPNYALTINPNMRSSRTDDGVSAEAWTGSTEGDVQMSELDIYRARMVDRELWKPSVKAFEKSWTAWKRSEGVIDFTDMIEMALADIEVAPGSPEVGFFDEVQDFTRLELTLIRKWGSHMERMVLAGDDDQCIFAFTGATPDAFLDPPLPDADKKVLAQSWRVPGAVHRAAEHWVQQLGRREPKVYLPRDDEGLVRTAPLAYASPGPIVTAAAEAADAGKTVMLLATCGYMLDPLKHEMRRQGVPFHNPYRPSRGDWNPLTPGRGVASKDRLLAYLILDERMFGEAARLWTGLDVKRWTECVKTTGVFRRGAKNLIADLPDRELSYSEIASLFDDDVELEQAVTPDIEWFARNLLASKRPVMEFPVQVARKRGGAALVGKPNICIGTIHSVKGGQCSPPDEPVLTTNRGWVPIADLNPDSDRLVSFNSDHHKIHRGGPRRPDGYAFTKASRQHQGDLLTVETASSRTRVTPNHWLTVRWTPPAMTAFAVYLMRRGNWWRIGVTKLHHEHGQSGPLMRMGREHADQAWLLHICDSYNEALYLESLWSRQFQVPDLTFEQNARTSAQLTSSQLHSIWDRIDSGTGAKALLDYRQQSVEWPLWDAIPDGHLRRRQSGLRNRWQVRAANLHPNYMQIPTDPGSGQEPTWRSFTIDRAPYGGPVYSLEVERWQHYVSGGAIVHNSDIVYLMPDLSNRGAEEWHRHGEPQDSVRRQFYVGMTRAKEELVVCAPSGSGYVDPHQLIKGARRAA